MPLLARRPQTKRLFLWSSIGVGLAFCLCILWRGFLSGVGDRGESIASLSPLLFTERSSERSVTKHALCSWHLFEIVKHIVDAFGELVTEGSPIVTAHGVICQDFFN